MPEKKRWFREIPSNFAQTHPSLTLSRGPSCFYSVKPLRFGQSRREFVGAIDRAFGTGWPWRERWYLEDHTMKENPWSLAVRDWKMMAMVGRRKTSLSFWDCNIFRGELLLKFQGVTGGHWPMSWSKILSKKFLWGLAWTPDPNGGKTPHWLKDMGGELGWSSKRRPLHLEISESHLDPKAANFLGSNVGNAGNTRKNPLQWY